MSLLNDNMETFRLLNKQTIEDGYGGYIRQWTDGTTFQAAAVKDDSIQTQIAMAQGVTAIYTITTSKAVNLDFHDVVRRERDRKIFRVTTDGSDKATPSGATLNMRQVRAEEWQLPVD